MKFLAKIRNVTNKFDTAGDLYTDVTLRFYQGHQPESGAITANAKTAMKLMGLQCMKRDTHITVEIPEVGEE